MGNPTTPNLGLNKIDRTSPETTYFDLNKYIDQNAEKVDAFAGEIHEEVSGLQDRLNNAETEEITLNPGLQVVNSPKDSRFKLGEIKGRTLINLLGSAGDCEQLSLWHENGATMALDSSRAYGERSVKLTSVGLADWGGTAWTTAKFDVTKYYVLVADVRNVDATGGSIMVSIPDIGNVDGNLASTTRKFSPSILLLSPGVMAGNIPSSVHLLVAGSSGKSALFDGVRIYEITQMEYDTLATMTPEQIAERYPFVTSEIVGVENPYAIGYGENLLPPFYEWTGNYLQFNKIQEPYTYVQTEPTLPFMATYFVIDVPQGGQTYTWSFIAEELGAYGAVWGIPRDGSDTRLLFAGIGQGKTGYTSFTFTIGGAYSAIQVGFLNDSAGGTYTFKKPMLVFGSVAKPFNPQRKSMLALQTTLHANPSDGSDPDVLFEKKGEYFKLAKWNKVILDGSQGFVIHDASQKGFKSVRATINDAMYSPQFTVTYGELTKYNGVPLAKQNAATSEDSFYLDGSLTALVLSIPNAESGWGDDFTPTADDISAFFRGWATAHNNGTKPFTNVGIAAHGHKVWVPVLGFNGTNGTPTLPTEISSTAVAAGWKPYQILYHLAKETVEPVPFEGTLMLAEGQSMVEVGTGIVLRESVSPAFYVDGTNPRYWINDIAIVNATLQGQEGILNYATNDILTVFKNRMEDTKKWNSVRSDAAPHSGELVYAESYDFDVSASYTVTYLKMDKSPIQPIIGFVAANEKAQIIDLVETASVAGMGGLVNSESISVKDAGGHFMADKLEDVLAELFTFANSGKTGLAAVIGAPAKASHSFAQLQSRLQINKNALAMQLTNKGVPAAGTETTLQLVDKVSGIIRAMINHAAFESTLPTEVGSSSASEIGANSEGIWMRLTASGGQHMARLLTPTGQDSGVTWLTVTSMTGNTTGLDMRVNNGYLYVFYLGGVPQQYIQKYNRAGQLISTTYLSQNIVSIANYCLFVLDEKLVLTNNMVINTYSLAGTLLSSQDTADASFIPREQLGYFEDGKYLYVRVGNSARLLAINKSNGMAIKTNSYVINMR
ncbi:MAG: hypothetical protein E6Y08_21445 [Paenibacillus sp.]|uniref:hypothetical protein n=1 Tax=Paenibacillus sp. TaxID=58172 RepID=UPI002911526D|nr:hypothetical protein [Paenibacillus sp.]MDU4698384.1 hypothetical protein [Paenibacillus sp.]